MTDENKLSRRGFFGALAAIGLAPALPMRPMTVSTQDYAATEVEEVDVFVDGEPNADVHGTQLLYEEDGEWRRAGQVTEVDGPTSLVPIGFEAGLEFTMLVPALFNTMVFLEMVLDGTKARFQLAFDDGLGTAWEFDAYATDVDITEEMIDGHVPMVVTLGVVGEPSLTSALPGTIEV